MFNLVMLRCVLPAECNRPVLRESPNLARRVYPCCDVTDVVADWFWLLVVVAVWLPFELLTAVVVVAVVVIVTMCPTLDVVDEVWLVFCPDEMTSLLAVVAAAGTAADTVGAIVVDVVVVVTTPPAFDWPLNCVVDSAIFFVVAFDADVDVWLDFIVASDSLLLAGEFNLTIVTPPDVWFTSFWGGETTSICCWLKYGGIVRNQIDNWQQSLSQFRFKWSNHSLPCINISLSNTC